MRKGGQTQAAFDELLTAYLRRQSDDAVKAELRSREKARAERAAGGGGRKAGGGGGAGSVDDDDGGGAGKKRRAGGGGKRHDEDDDGGDEDGGGAASGGGSKKARKSLGGPPLPSPVGFGGSGGGSADTATLQQQLAQLTSVVQQLVQVSVRRDGGRTGQGWAAPAFDPRLPCPWLLLLLLQAQSVAAGQMSHVPGLSAGPGIDMAHITSILANAMQQGGGGMSPAAAPAPAPKQAKSGGGGHRKGGGRKGGGDDDDDDEDFRGGGNTGGANRWKSAGGAGSAAAAAGGGRKSLGGGRSAAAAAATPVLAMLTFDEKKALSEDVMLLSPQVGEGRTPLVWPPATAAAATSACAGHGPAAAAHLGAHVHRGHAG